MYVEIEPFCAWFLLCSALFRHVCGEFVVTAARCFAGALRPVAVVGSVGAGPGECRCKLQRRTLCQGLCSWRGPRGVDSALFGAAAVSPLTGSAGAKTTFVQLCPQRYFYFTLYFSKKLFVKMYFTHTRI